MDRRAFLKGSVGALTGGALGLAERCSASGMPDTSNGYAMLIDTTACVGCRKCEWACAQQNGLSDAPMESFEDQSIFERHRRMDAASYTVVNRFPGTNEDEDPVYVKHQCLHCLKPACVSACLVGALTRHPEGAVIYDAGKCIGCRYCMIACPFEVPAYEFSNALAPQVRKCILCASRFDAEGKIPACAEICPPMAITFSKRDELLALAHEKIAQAPERYINHVYGEHEAGGTSVLYLAGMPFTSLGLPLVSEKPIPDLPETIQHGVFKYGVPPLLAFALIGAVMRSFAPEDHEGDPARPASVRIDREKKS